MNPGKVIATATATTAVYLCLALAGAIFFTGAGHGTDFFTQAALSPFVGDSIAVFWIGLTFWAVVGALVGLRQWTVCRTVAVIALVLHYLGLAMLAAHTEWSYVGRVWRATPFFVAAFVAVYLVSQTVFWWALVRRRHEA
jgi:hypothetical protein